MRNSRKEQGGRREQRGTSREGPCFSPGQVETRTEYIRSVLKCREACYQEDAGRGRGRRG